MIRKTLFIFLLLAFVKTEAQKSTCEPSLLYQINTESGMKMRAGPSVNDAVVVYIPAKSQLLVCEELSTPATIENIAGHWRKVKYKEKYGYMFDGFLAPVEPLTENSATVKDFKLAQLLIINRVLAQDMRKIDSVLEFLSFVAKANGYEKIIGPPLPDRDSLFDSSNISAQQPITDVPEKVEDTPKEKPIEQPKQPIIEYKFITESFNFCGDITSLDPGKIWYGIFQKDGRFLRQRINLLIIRSKYSLGKGLEFDLKVEEDIQPLFLISSSKLLEEDWYVTLSSAFLDQNTKKLFPGQMLELYGKDPIADLHNVNLYATGNVKSVGACPEIADYKIKVTGEKQDALITQDLTPIFDDLGSCGIPEIYWFGDFNGDQYPDIIFISNSDNGFAYTFFISDTQNSNLLYRKADQWFNYNCD